MRRAHFIMLRPQTYEGTKVIETVVPLSPTIFHPRCVRSVILNLEFVASKFGGKAIEKKVRVTKSFIVTFFKFANFIQRQQFYQIFENRPSDTSRENIN